MSTATTAITVSSTAKHWGQWFKSKESATTINKAHQETLLLTFDHSKTKDQALEAVLKHEEVTFLHKIMIGSKQVAMFHHLIEVGGTIYDAGSKEYGFIQDVEADTSQPLTPDIEALFKTPTMITQPVPTINAIMGVKTKEEVDALVTSATVTYRPRNFVPVPPFLMEKIQKTITTSNGDVREVLIATVVETKKFDMEHQADAEYTNKAQTKSKQLLQWLYLVSKDSIAIEKVATIGCSNAKVMQQMYQLTRINLEVDKTNQDGDTISTQVDTSLKRPLEVLAASTASTSEFMDKLTQLQDQNANKTAKMFKKIPAKFQQMILVASSLSEVTEIDYDAEAVEFFKCSATLHAQVMLNSILETENIECSVSPAMTTMLLMGSFLWRNAFSPSGLAASVLTTEGIMKTDTLHERHGIRLCHEI